jgi:hypothetical protein
MIVDEWEYYIKKTYNTPTTEMFNELGNDGWELVGNEILGDSGAVLYFFKRPKRLLVYDIGDNNCFASPGQIINMHWGK